MQSVRCVANLLISAASPNARLSSDSDACHIHERRDIAGADKIPQGRVARSRSSSKSRQGEGVGSYTIDTSGQIAAFGQRFTALVTAGIQESTTQDSLEAFVSMATVLLHCQEAALLRRSKTWCAS